MAVFGIFCTNRTKLSLFSFDCKVKSLFSWAVPPKKANSQTGLFIFVNIYIYGIYIYFSNLYILPNHN